MVQSFPGKRRTFLKGAGVLTLGLAGCMGKQRQTTPTPTGGPNGTDDGTPEPTMTESENPAPAEDLSWWIKRGEVIDSFNTFAADWRVDQGKARASKATTFNGGQSAFLSSEGDSRARIKRTFSTSLDLTNKDVSLAVRLKSTTLDLLQVSVYMRDLFGGYRLLTGSVQANATDRWVRLDLGFQQEEDFVSRAVKEIWVGCRDGASQITEFYVDDIRAVPKPEKGIVMLTFDDSSPRDYMEAFPTLQKYGWAGTAFPVISRITEGSTPSIGHYKEMVEAGWVVGGHTLNHERLPDFTRGDQDIILSETRRQLDEKGLSGEFVPFRTTYGDYDSNSLDLMTSHFDVAYAGTGSASGSAAYVSDPRTIGFVPGDDLETAKSLVDKAAAQRQLAGLTIHMGNIEYGQLDALCAHINSHVKAGRIEVLTTAEHYARFVA